MEGEKRQQEETPVLLGPLPLGLEINVDLQLAGRLLQMSPSVETEPFTERGPHGQGLVLLSHCLPGDAALPDKHGNTLQLFLYMGKLLFLPLILLSLLFPYV
ncbi:hypothetical protein ACOMHN_062907 [Nucella lapillus]